MSDDDLLNVAEAAKFLKVSGSLLDKLRYNGEGPDFIKYAARCVRYRRGSLKAYQEQKTFRSTAQQTARKTPRREAASRVTRRVYRSEGEQRAAAARIVALSLNRPRT